MIPRSRSFLELSFSVESGILFSYDISLNKEDIVLWLLCLILSKMSSWFLLSILISRFFRSLWLGLFSYLLLSTPSSCRADESPCTSLLSYSHIYFIEDRHINHLVRKRWPISLIVTAQIICRGNL